jgi:carnitine-CoA ligase
MMTLLSVTDLHVSYGKVEAISGVSLEMQAGNIVTVIGPNGAGKTTLLAALMGLLPSKGESWYDAQDLGILSTEERVRRGICLVPERRELFTEMTVADNLVLGAYTRWGDREAVQRDLQEVYERFPRLSERRGQLAATLSGGERQMLALGRALMAKPRLLLLDEPSLGLAPLIVREIFRIVTGLRELGVSILLVEQNARAALETADYGYVLETGCMVSASQLRAQWSQLFAPTDRTLPAMLTRQAERFAQKPLVTAGRTTWTYAETCEAAARCAGILRSAGIQPGDRVAIICSNRIEFLEIVLGCAWLGAVAVPINVASRGPQLQHILSNCAARLLVMEAVYAENLAFLDPPELAIEAVWLMDGTTEVSIGEVRSISMPLGRERIAAAAVRPDDPALILYTSGTTGPSKGVCCPQAQYFWWAVNTASLLQLRADDVLCTSLPLFHTNALNTFYQALLIGASVCFEKRFSASRFFASLTQHRATVTYLLGAMVPILLSRPSSPEESAHTVRIALAPGVPAQFHEEFKQRTGIRLLDGWGSTETNFVLGTTIEKQKPGLMGPVFEGFRARVVDDQDSEVADDTAGELVVRADDPFAFATGYFRAPDKTAEAWRNLWFHTGDRVVRQSDGYFRFIDRLKDAIRRRGENISSFEVEQVLLSHSAVANAAAFPVRSPLAEDEVMAAVILHPGQRLSEAELIAFCEPRLPYFAVPRYLEFVHELPTTESGKVQKYKLRERGVTQRTWDREASHERPTQHSGA